MFPDAAEYRSARPFPHAVIDDAFIGPGFLDGVDTEFPWSDDDRWLTFDTEHEHGKQQLANEYVAFTFPKTGAVLRVMQSEMFVMQLEQLTGITGLIPDIAGGGMHQTTRGGFLNMHVDSATDFGVRETYRRLNVLLYLNHDYDGGELTLARRLHDTFVDEVQIAPRWNRLVVFETTRASWHGHTTPWRLHKPRRSLAVYYYTKDAPEGFDAERETTFVA